MNAARRCALYQALQSLDPHPTTELEYQTPFELLIAVMLSAQATDVSVNKATRIFRVANRTGLAPGRTVREVEKALEAATPREFQRHAHHWLILHGRYVCKARRPECWHCAIAPLCEFQSKTPPP